MQEGANESNTSNEPDHNTTHNHVTRQLHFVTTWLNKSDKNKLECYSAIFGVTGIGFIVLGLCIFIITHMAYESDLINGIDCSIINITHTHVKLCDSYRCSIFNHCIPYVCTIVFVRYHHNDILNESKLFSFNNPLNSQCSYEPSSCSSHSRIRFEQVTFLNDIMNQDPTVDPCCLHLSTQKPVMCYKYIGTKGYAIRTVSMALCFLIGIIFMSFGIIVQLHFNNYLKSSHQREEDFLDTILNGHLSTGTMRSIMEKSTPVNYDILTQTLSQHNTPSATKTYPNDNLLLFDIDEENKIFQNECIRSNYQEKLLNEVIRQYQLGNDEIKCTLKTIEDDFRTQNSSMLPEDPIEKIKYLLETFDNLDLYFPNMNKRVSVDQNLDTISLGRQASPLSSVHPHVHFAT